MLLTKPILTNSLIAKQRITYIKLYLIKCFHNIQYYIRLPAVVKSLRRCPFLFWHDAICLRGHSSHFALSSYSKYVIVCMETVSSPPRYYWQMHVSRPWQLWWMLVREVIRRLRVRPPPGQQHSFMEIEIFSPVILSLLLIQVGQSLGFGKRMCTIVVNSSEEKCR